MTQLLAGKSRDSSEDRKQRELDQKTAEVIESNGGINFLYAEYLRKFAEVAVGGQEPILSRLQPDIKINMDDPSWELGLRATLAFLKRYKMNETTATMRIEFPETPEKTGFAKRSNLDSFFDQIAETIEDVRKTPFQTQVDEFATEAGLPINKPKSSKKGAPQPSEASRSEGRRHKH